MMPNNAISITPISSPFLPPDDERSGPDEDFEDGGVAIQDASQGLTGHRWRCYTDQTSVFLERDGASPVTVFTQSGIQDIAFAFDQNMRHNVAYQLSDGNIYLRWFDPTVPGYVVTNFGPGKHPRMCLDDKRASQIASSDVLLAYMRDGSLLYRMQRDRYLVEYVAAFGLASSLRLRNIGMGLNWRLQFELA